MTVDAAASIGEAVAVKCGRILHVGLTVEVQVWVRARARFVA